MKRKKKYTFELPDYNAYSDVELITAWEEHIDKLEDMEDSFTNIIQLKHFCDNIMHIRQMLQILLLRHPNIFEEFFNDRYLKNILKKNNIDSKEDGSDN